MTLNPQQADAAHRLEQDVCVIAGPGSGKTRVLIERFSWLVTERRVAPHRILAITFTEKAATEIKERLVKQFADNVEVREQIERAYVSTIHAFCARLLRENSIAAGIDPEFSVMDVAQSVPLLRDCVDEVLEAVYQADPARMRRFLRSLSVGTLRGSFVPDLAGSLEEIYETLRVAGASVAELRQPPPAYDDLLARLRIINREILGESSKTKTPKQEEQHATALEWSRHIESIAWDTATPHALAALCRKKLDSRSLVKDSAAHRHETELRDLTARLRGVMIMHYYAPERELVAEALGAIDALYRRRKRLRSALDFDDLEEVAIRLLEHDPELRARIQRSFDYVLMDELQDTNPLQWRLVSLVRSPANFFAVGDVNQSIYGFRHAEPALFHGYRDQLRDAGLAVDELRTNYRTRATVLDAVNLAFTAVGGVEAHTLEAGASFCDKSSASVEAIVVRAEDSDTGEEMEARWVARRIVELVGTLRVGDGRPARFGDIAILTRANQSTGDLQRALDEFHIPSIVLGGQTFFETREIRDLKLLIDVLVNPTNEVSLAGLLRSPMFGVSDDDLLRLYQVGGSLSKGVALQPPPHWDTIEELREIRNVVSPERLLQRVIDESDYLSGLTDRGRGNVEKFLSTLRDRYQRTPRPLVDLVREVEQAAPEAEAPPADFGDAVRLMTMHKAKGLEFPIVFLPYLHRGRSNDYPILSYTRANGLGVKWREPETGEALSDCIREANKKIQVGASDEEENRLLYVGMTRAMEHLVLSWTGLARPRASWCTLIAPRLGVQVDFVMDQPLERNERRVRVLVTDRPPEPLEAAGSTILSEEIPIVADAVANGLHESAVTVTDVSRFLECPQKYFLSRYLRRQAPPRRLAEIEEEEMELDRDGLDAGEVGTQVHALLAGEPVENPTVEAVGLAEVFRASELGRLAGGARRVFREWDFVMEVSGVVVRGQVDLWFETAKELVIVDYKTDRVRRPVDPGSVTGYALQVQIYAEAIERATGKRPTRGVLYFLRPDEIVEVDLSPLARAAALDMVRQLAEAQQRLDFLARTGDQCRHCDHGGKCAVPEAPSTQEVECPF